MTTNPVPRRIPLNQRTLVVMTVVVGFAIATLILTRTSAPLTALSPVAGLISLKAAAQTAMPYSQAMASPHPTLIEFYADWCTTCQAMAPTLESLRLQFGDQVNFVMLNIDDPQWSPQMRQFGVTGIPHLALVQPDHTLVDRWIGKVPAGVLVEGLQQAVRG